MAGLVGYDSSDEDDEVQQPGQTQAMSQPPKHATENGANKPVQPPPQAPQPQPPAQPPSSSSSNSQQAPVQGPTLGPALGPSLPPSTGTPEPSSDPASAPPTTTLSLLQDLTLPPVPNTAIPPSPPGSPTQTSRALTAKFDNFLALKRTKGIHFNDRLASSEAFRNPGAMDKLLGFVGVETDFDGEGKSEEEAGKKKKPGTGQYETTLPEGVWEPNALPGWAYKTPLRRAQERGQKERERKVGEGVEFVSAGVMESPGLVGSGTPGVGAVPSVTGKRKTRFDS